MVRAILEGRKTQTRRIIKEIPAATKLIWFDNAEWIVENDEGRCWKGQLKQRCKVGDILWVRETWLNNDGHLPTDLRYVYKAELGEKEIEYSKELNVKWRPSIFMPYEAARIFLKVRNVRVEKLHDIDEFDAIREGIEKGGYDDYKYWNYLKDVSNCLSPKDSFKTLWQKINGQDSWNENPFVWVIEFERCERPLDSH